MLPAERCDVGKKLVGNDLAARAQLVDGAAEMASVHYRDTDIRHLGQNVKVRTDKARTLII